MFHRFAAACVVGSFVIAAGALVGVLAQFPSDGFRVLTLAWCFVPAVWGCWAMLTPPDWVPDRLPAWGAILGVAAGAVAGPLLDLPARFGAPSGAIRWLALLIGPILYYAVWLLVRSAYRSLSVTGR
jgi:hypothetical protein